MSAESKFVSLLRAANFSESTTRSVVDEILGEHAHELAEKIRGKVYEFLTPRYGFGGDPKSPWVQGQMDAADLIDPEVDDD